MVTVVVKIADTSANGQGRKTQTVIDTAVDCSPPYPITRTQRVVNIADTSRVRHRDGLFSRLFLIWQVVKLRGTSLLTKPPRSVRSLATLAFKGLKDISLLLFPPHFSPTPLEP